MRIRKNLLAAAFAVALIPSAARAQSSSINTFSPFTFYGLGDLSLQGATYIRGAGGAATALRAGGTINYVNPASLSMVYRKSFLFEVGLEGGNYFLRSDDGKSSFNTFNVRDIAIKFPLYDKLGFGVSLTPFSSVGYRIKIIETDPEILAELLRDGAIGAIYNYDGSGGVNQAKASIGWEPVKNLSIGVDMVYYFGKLNRSFTTSIINYTSSSFRNTQASQTEHVSRILWNFGVQYDVVHTDRRIVTTGATFQPAAKLNSDVNISVYDALGNVRPLGNSIPDNFTMPDLLSAGVSFLTPRLGFGLDYSYQTWADHNESHLATPPDGTIGVAFRNTNAVRMGMDYTPNLYDTRNFFRRLTYRVGVRYSDYYMKFNDTGISDATITLGLGIPVRIMSTREFGTQSYIDLGIDLGRRGTTRNNLIRENYFKISVGLRLFGNDQWFRKLQYQ